MMTALLGNEQYDELPGAIERLEKQRKLARPLISDGSGCGPALHVEVLKLAADMVRLGAECVSIRYGCFLVMHMILNTTDMTQRKRKIDEYFRQCKEKKVELGRDTVDKLEELKRDP